MEETGLGRDEVSDEVFLYEKNIEQLVLRSYLSVEGSNIGAKTFGLVLERYKLNTLTIGNVPIQGKVFMAPLAGVGGPAFRQIAREQGASLVITPLICSTALVYGSQKSFSMAQFRPVEEPRAVQIFGADSEIMTRAAVLLKQRGATIIDLNFGCPAKRIVASGAGAKLMLDMEKLYRIASSVVEAVFPLPVTAKIRAGWDRQTIKVVETVRLLERAGVKLITLHARTRSDSPATPPNWEWIADAVRETSIPVVGNGGISSPADAIRLRTQTGCSAVMVGRAAVGRPWLLGQCEKALQGADPGRDPEWPERLRIALRHLALQTILDPEQKEVRITAGLFSAYFRTMPGARAVRPLLFRPTSYPELQAIMESVVNRMQKDSGNCQEFYENDI